MHGASKSVSCQREIASSLFHFPLDVSYAFTLFLYYFEYLFIRWMKSVKKRKERHKLFQSSPISSNLWIFLSSSIYQFFKSLKSREDQKNSVTFSIATVVVSRSITGRSVCRQIKMIGLLAHFPPLLSFFLSFFSLSHFFFLLCARISFCTMIVKRLRDPLTIAEGLRSSSTSSSRTCTAYTCIVPFINGTRRPESASASLNGVVPRTPSLFRAMIALSTLEFQLNSAYETGLMVIA